MSTQTTWAAARPHVPTHLGADSLVPQPSSLVQSASRESSDSLDETPRSRLAARQVEARSDLAARTVALFTERDAATDDAARDRAEEALVRLHLPLADGIASRYSGRGIERDDLVQVARLGLLKAVHRFSADRGVVFPAFASPTITGEVKRHFRDHGWAVRPPRRLQELHARVGPASRDLEQRLHRPPLTEELAGELQVEVTELTQALEAATGFTTLSFDHRPGDDAPSLEQQLPAEDDEIEHIEDRVSLRAAIGTLDPRERLVVTLRFDDDLTQSQIAKRLGVSQMQVSRILTKLLTQLREELAPHGVHEAA